MMTDLGIVAIVTARLSCDHNNTLYFPSESRLSNREKRANRTKDSTGSERLSRSEDLLLLSYLLSHSGSASNSCPEGATVGFSRKSVTVRQVSCTVHNAIPTSESA